MTALELKTALKDVPDDTEVLVRAGNNDLGNVWHPKKVEASTYGFFGKPVSCVIIEHSGARDKNTLWPRPRTKTQKPTQKPST